MVRSIVIVGLVLSAVLALPPTASALDRPERVAFTMVNHARERHGLRLVRLRARLSRYAERHTRRMARRRRLYHSALRLAGYSALGECVGEGDSVRSVQHAFMHSRDHRQIILGRWRWVGIGVARRDGIVYVTEVFAR